MLDSSEHETPTAHKLKCKKIKALLIFKLSDVVFIMIVDVKNVSDCWHFNNLCAVDGAPSQISTLKFLTPAPPSPTPRARPQQWNENSV